jgi:hypothetical protein
MDASCACLRIFAATLAMPSLTPAPRLVPCTHPLSLSGSEDHYAWPIDVPCLRAHVVEAPPGRMLALQSGHCAQMWPLICEGLSKFPASTLARRMTRGANA